MSLIRPLAFYNALLDGLGATPGATSMEPIASLPLSDLDDRELAVLSDDAGADSDLSAHGQVVTGGTSTALGAQILASRGFVPADGASPPRIAIASRALACALWPAAPSWDCACTSTAGPAPPQPL